MTFKALTSNLRVRLLAVSLLAVLPVVGVTIWTDLDYLALDRREAVEANLRLARLAAAQEAEAIEGSRLMLATLARAVDGGGLDLDRCEHVLLNVLRDHPSHIGIALFDRHGELLCGTEPGGGIMGRYRDFIARVTQPSWKLLDTRGGDRQAFLVAHPVKGDSGNVSRVLVAASRLVDLGRLESSLGLSPDTTLAIVDTGGRVISQDSTSESVGHVRPNQSNKTSEAMSPDGIRRFFSVAPIETGLRAGLSLELGVPAAEMFRDVDTAMRHQLWLLGFVFLGAVMAVLAGSERYILGPVKALKQAAQRVAAGDLTARAELTPVAPGLQELASAFNDMVVSLQQHALALVDRTRVTSIIADVGLALNRRQELASCLQACADALVHHLPATVLRVWTVDQSGTSHLLRASAGTQGRCASGSAAAPIVVRHPLAVQDRLYGVMTLFSCAPVSDVVLAGLASVVDHIALTIAREEAQRAKREAEARMRFALEAAHVGVWEANLKTGASYWSETCEALHGLDPGAFGKTFEALAERIHPDDRESALQSIQQAIDQRQELNLTYRTRWPSGTDHWIHSTARFFYDADGTPLRGAGVSVDVTERRLLEDQFRQAQKMEAVGRLAGGVAHDFNNLLTAIMGYTSLLAAQSNANEQTLADLGEIRKASESAAALTRQLLAFSRKQVLRPQDMSLNDVVARAEALLRRTIGEDVALVLDPNEELGTIHADPWQMEQIIMNLAVNARDAMPKGGQLVISTGNVDVSIAAAARLQGLTPGPHVVLSVADTGIGMTPEVRTRIFEPFFTTKAEGLGTGLGLATVYGIVRQSGGAISVESEVGRGTTFKMYFPTTPPGLERTAPRAIVRVQDLPAATETILVVEDQAAVRGVIRKSLAAHGYRILEAGGRTETSEALRRHEGPVHLVLTDVVMPRTSGREIASLVRARHPEVCVLFMSGYTDRGVDWTGLPESNEDFLQKPFSPDALRLKIRELLERTVGDQPATAT